MGFPLNDGVFSPLSPLFMPPKIVFMEENLEDIQFQGRGLVTGYLYNVQET